MVRVALRLRHPSDRDRCRRVFREHRRRVDAEHPARLHGSSVGFFGNQNTVCKPVTPKWRQTVDRLKELFPGYDGHPQPSMSGAATPTPIGHGLVPPPPND